MQVLLYTAVYTLIVEIYFLPKSAPSCLLLVFVVYREKHASINTYMYKDTHELTYSYTDTKIHRFREYALGATYMCVPKGGI